jgi:hypothetical protein
MTRCGGIGDEIQGDTSTFKSLVLDSSGGLSGVPEYPSLSSFQSLHYSHLLLSCGLQVLQWCHGCL